MFAQKRVGDLQTIAMSQRQGRKASPTRRVGR